MSATTIADITPLDPDAVALSRDLDASFESIVRAYQGRVYGFVLRLLGDAERAEEVAQDVFVRAYRALQTYDRERIRTLRLRAWLFTIATNLARNATRRKKLDMVAWDATDTTREPHARERTELSALQADAARHLHLALLTLPAPTRSAIVMRHLEGLGYDAIAQILGQPEGTVKGNVHRGLIRLRTALAHLEHD